MSRKYCSKCPFFSFFCNTFSLVERDGDMTTVLESLMAAPPGERWLEAHNDPLASIYTFSSCIALSDLSGDGDFRSVQHLPSNIYMNDI